MEITLFSTKKKNESLILNLPTQKIIGLFGIDLSYLDIKKINFIDSNCFDFYTASVKAEINFYCKLKHIKDKSFKDKLELDMKKMGLDLLEGYRKISTLSDSEKFLFYLLLKIEFSSQTLIINDLFKYLDRNNKKMVLNFIRDEICNCDSILIIDNDINNLYHYTDYIYIVDKFALLTEGNTKEVLTNVEYLVNNHIDVPYLPLLTYQAKLKKGIRLFYHQDIRDIIKDIYKHV